MMMEVFSNVVDAEAGDNEISDEAASALLRRAFGLPIDRTTDELPSPSTRVLAGCALCEAECNESFGKSDAVARLIPNKKPSTRLSTTVATSWPPRDSCDTRCLQVQ